MIKTFKIMLILEISQNSPRFSHKGRGLLRKKHEKP